MIQRIFLFILITIFLCSCNVTVKDNTTKISQHELLVRNYINNVNSGDYKNAAEYFNYPDYYSKEIKDKDVSGVSLSIKILTEEFGKIESHDIDDNKIKLIQNIFIGGGDLKYLKKHESDEFIRYKVKYSKAGQGYLKFTFINLNNNLEILKVDYGLPSNESSKTIIKNTLERMMEEKK